MEHSETLNFTGGGSEIVQRASPLVSCFWCERLHPGEHPLAVCPACAARYSTMRSLEIYVGRSDSDVRQRLHEWVGMPSPTESHGSFAKASWGVHRRGQLPVDAPALGRVGNAESRYTHFAYSYAPSVEDAYAHEWRNYDAFGGSHGLDNETEPVSAAA
jgi:hypothetical protein